MTTIQYQTPPDRMERCGDAQANKDVCSPFFYNYFFVEICLLAQLVCIIIKNAIIKTTILCLYWQQFSKLKQTPSSSVSHWYIVFVSTWASYQRLSCWSWNSAHGCSFQTATKSALVNFQRAADLMRTTVWTCGSVMKNNWSPGDRTFMVLISLVNGRLDPR